MKHGVCLLAAERGEGGGVYFLTDGEPVRFRDFVTRLLATQGVDPGDRSLPRGLARILAWTVEALWTLLRLRRDPPFTRTALELLGEPVTVSDAKARRELGYEARMTVDRGLAELRDLWETLGPEEQRALPGSREGLRSPLSAAHAGLSSSGMSDAPDPLADGSSPATPADLFRRLEELGIETETVEHAPVYTVEEAQAVRSGLAGAHVKNLFLRNHKKEMFLLVCEEERPIDLKALGRGLGWGKLSFGSAERLMSYLGVIPGAVTPFGALNDAGGAVSVAIERVLLDAERVHCHPLDNARTTAIAPGDLVRFLEAVDHAPEVVDLDTLGGGANG